MDCDLAGFTKMLLVILCWYYPPLEITHGEIIYINPNSGQIFDCQSPENIFILVKINAYIKIYQIYLLQNIQLINRIGSCIPNLGCFKSNNTLSKIDYLEVYVRAKISPPWTSVIQILVSEVHSEGGYFFLGMSSFVPAV